MLNRIANRHAEREQQHLRTSKERRAKDDIADRPPVLERAEDEDELQDDIDGNADDRPDQIDDEERDRFGVAESELLLEGGDGDEKGDAEHEETRDAQELGMEKHVSALARSEAGGWKAYP